MEVEAWVEVLLVTERALPLTLLDIDTLPVSSDNTEVLALPAL